MALLTNEQKTFEDHTIWDGVILSLATGSEKERQTLYFTDEDKWVLRTMNGDIDTSEEVSSRDAILWLYRNRYNPTDKGWVKI